MYCIINDFGGYENRLTPHLAERGKVHLDANVFRTLRLFEQLHLNIPT